jgi:hypothetical protein
MSTWLELNNELKRQYNSGYLTTTQRAAYVSLLDHLRGPHWVNLHGQPGCGKTLLAWLTARATGLTYVTRPSDLRHIPSAPDGLIIDNAPVSEEGARAVLAECGLLNSLTILLVTQQPIAMPMRRVELSMPTTNDIQTVAQTLARMGYLCNRASLPEHPSYWDVLSACI